MPPRLFSGSHLVLALVSAAVAVGCGEIPEPEGFAAASSTTTDEGGGVVLGVGEDGGGEAAGPTPTTAFVPSPPEGYVPQVLMAADGQVLTSDLVETGRVPGPVAQEQAIRVIDDLLGGLVVERMPPSTEIVWIPQVGDPETIEGGGARLLDVGYVAGTPVAIVLADDEKQVEGIRLVDLEQTSIVDLADDEDLLSLSASGGLIALVVGNDQCGDLRFYDSEGDELGLDGPGEPDCIVPRRPAYGAVALSPDGGALAYTLVSYRDDGIEAATEILVRDLISGVNYFTRKIGEDGDSIRSLSFDGDRVVYVREAVGVNSVTVLEIGGAETETPVDVGTSSVADASFARLPLADEG